MNTTAKHKIVVRSGTLIDATIVTDRGELISTELDPGQAVHFVQFELEGEVEIVGIYPDAASAHDRVDAIWRELQQGG
jgi:predicted cupin superfamily sugar epimerase